MVDDPNSIMHFGILGMKWGVRRYENKDGTLTPEGKKRYRKGGDDQTEEQDDIGLAYKRRPENKKSGIGGILAAAGLALAGASAMGQYKAKHNSIKDPSKMTAEELTADNKKSSARKLYEKNHGLKSTRETVNDISNNTTSMVRGIRNYRNIGKSGNSQPQNRYNTRKTLSQKEMDAMSDQDLQKLVSRLNLETSYSRLTSEPEAIDTVDLGLQRAEAVLGVVGSAVTIGTGAAYIYSKMRR
jgi:hypothetical protein